MLSVPDFVMVVQHPYVRHDRSAGTPADYANAPAYCMYYDWDMRSGADIGLSKTLWDWIGGSDGYDCGFSSSSDMSSHFGGSQHGLRLAVCSLAWAANNVSVSWKSCKM